jgi:hypothetical protein
MMSLIRIARFNCAFRRWSEARITNFQYKCQIVTYTFGNIQSIEFFQSHISIFSTCHLAIADIAHSTTDTCHQTSGDQILDPVVLFRQIAPFSDWQSTRKITEIRNIDGNFSVIVQDGSLQSLRSIKLMQQKLGVHSQSDRSDDREALTVLQPHDWTVPNF